MNNKQKEIIAIVAVIAAGVVALVVALTLANQASEERYYNTSKGLVPVSELKKFCKNEHPELLENMCIGIVLEGLNK